jgi:hypothetical protein
MREPSAPFGDRRKAVKVLAQSIFRELRENGYTPNQIVNLSSELIGLITTEIAAVGTTHCEP